MEIKNIFENLLDEDNKEEIKKEIEKLEKKLSYIDDELEEIDDQGSTGWSQGNEGRRKSLAAQGDRLQNQIDNLKKKLKESLNEDKKQEAIKKLKMSDVAAKLAGGLSKDDAKKFLEKIGMDKKEIEKISGPDEDQDDDEIISD